MDSIDQLKKQNKELVERIKEQDTLINNMRDVLRFCARSSVGTYYQQESAKEMLLNNRKIVWERFNPDGTYNESYRKHIFDCGGQEALDLNDEEERSLIDNYELKRRKLKLKKLFKNEKDFFV